MAAMGALATLPAPAQGRVLSSESVLPPGQSGSCLRRGSPRTRT